VHQREAKSITELHNDVRVHDGDGADKTLHANRSAAQEPEEDCKGYTESHRTRSDAQCAQASARNEEEQPLALLVEGREEGL
jgi:hypothetical protein